jgi:glutathione S-transferase
MMLIADEGWEVEQQIIDILAGEQYSEAFTKINPSCFVPVLEDGDFRLIEGSAILKYLAEKSGSATYSTNLQSRARINEVMDWFNTNLYRGLGYGLVYPQVLDYVKLPDDAANTLMVVNGKTQAERFLKVLNDHILGQDAPWLCGEILTIADYLASGIISLGDVIGCTFTDYPNVVAWYDRIKALPNWQTANAGLYEWAKFAQGGDYLKL